MTLRAIFDTYQRSIAREARLATRTFPTMGRESGPARTF